MSSPNAEDYVIGWTCAIRCEFDAARLFLDEIYHGYETKHIVPDPYFCGRIGRYKIVVFLLPPAFFPHEYRSLTITHESYETAIKAVMRGFPKIRTVLAVGIGGGAPTQKNDIQLGDVVVGLARGTNKSVFTYDIGETLKSRRFESIEAFDPPSSISAAYIESLEGYWRLLDHLPEKQLWPRPQLTEKLYKSDFVHPEADQSCSTVCGRDLSRLVQRRTREGYEDAIRVHYGTIASSSEPMKDASVRDILSTEANVLCFETEAYGLLTKFPCLVIRGISNYSDSHTGSTDWEHYAAMSASLYASKLLRLLSRGAFDLQSVHKPSRFFRIGRCFVTRWVEPMSPRSGSRPSACTTPVTDSNGGVFTEMRRYIVIRESHRSSWCVPVHTYEGRGTAKPDIKLCDHAKIYQFGEADPDSEFPLRKPIGVVVEGENELHQLHPASLANFGKIYTIEHDVPISNIGYVPRSHLKRLKLDLNALEISTLDMKYQRLRRDEGLVNIQLWGKEKLQIQELDIGTEGSVNIVMAGESSATVQKLKGSNGSLNIRTMAQGILELGTVAVNGQINISLSGNSQVIVKELQEYRGFLSAAITDEAKLVMGDVKLMGGSFSLTSSQNSKSVVESLRGKGAYFIVKTNMQATLQINEAEFVESVVNANINGESVSNIKAIRNNGSSFTTRTDDKARFDIGRAWLEDSSATLMIGGKSEFTIDYFRGINTPLSQFISGLGQLTVKVKDYEVISGNNIERKEQLPGGYRERAGPESVSQVDQAQRITEDGHEDCVGPGRNIRAEMIFLAPRND
ncbi:hypothetical protein ANO14919_126730 [Xylariales sp. No.14919]|nr:hypothetical protein ANO14919_126730 [Xylariales sp. No.14919]